MAGRPSEKSHPAKHAKLVSQRYLQKLARESESFKATQNHNLLMATYYDDIGKVCQKLNEIRGNEKKSINISAIETICGTFEGRNVLEGFRANTEALCNERHSVSETNQFYKMCALDNMIIFEMAAN